MTPQKAKELRYTYHAKMYGFKGYLGPDEDGELSKFRGRFWLTDTIVEIMVYLDVTFDINEYGFPILLGEEL